MAKWPDSFKVKHWNNLEYSHLNTRFLTFSGGRHRLHLLPFVFLVDEGLSVDYSVTVPRVCISHTESVPVHAVFRCLSSGEKKVALVAAIQTHHAMVIQADGQGGESLEAEFQTLDIL